MTAPRTTDLSLLAIGLDAAMRRADHEAAQLAIDIARDILDRHQSTIIAARAARAPGCGPALTAERVRAIDATADLMHAAARGPHGRTGRAS